MPESGSLQTKSASPIPARKRERRLLHILVWAAVCLITLLVLLYVCFLLYLRSATRTALPTLDGELRLAGLSAPVTVRRDAHGVPHIEAANQQDLFLAQGYVTAQDRLWQMDIFRRNANGELSELLGPSLVRHDKTQRVLQLRNTARRIYANLDATDRACLDAYAHGVNLYIAQHKDSLPPEFRLLMYRPQPWTGVDSMSIVMMMVEMLDTHWYTKLSRDEISADLHNPKLEADLYPVGSWRDHPPTGIQLDLSRPHPEPQPDSDEDEENTQVHAAPPLGLHNLDSIRAALNLPACSGCAFGSNNWVISGEHTATGKPLLANDMHLQPTEPNIWYMADLKAPGFHAAGVTLPGLPFVVAGHNDHVAWGFTALYADVQDVYLETLDGAGHYQAADGSFKPLSVDHEIIKVRFGKDIHLDVLLTAHGPLLNPLFKKPIHAMALKWTLYDPTLNSMPIYAMNTASNWQEFSNALATWPWPSQNVVYSDDQGHIGFHTVGRIPLRPNGIANLPIPAAQAAAHQWQGYIPFDRMPNAFDPPAGLLATANSRVSWDEFPLPITNEWADPYRIERIYKSLQGRNRLTPADMLALQTDVYSEVDQELAHRFAYAIDHAADTDSRLKQAADLMRSWDGKLTPGSPAASIVTQTCEALWPLILEPKVGKDHKDYQWAESHFAEEEIVMHANPDWLPKNYKDWDALLTEAVRRGMKAGKAPSDLSRWTYGSWHTLDIEHPLATFLPFFGGFAGTGPQPIGGDTTTVKQSGSALAPSQRFTMDWSNIDGSTENIVLGESGNPLSPYYRDQWNDYYRGTTFTLPFTQQAVAAQTRHLLRLLP